MSRKQPKRRAGNMVFTAIAGIFILALVGGVGLGVASADSADDLARAGAFGFDAETQRTTSNVQDGASNSESMGDALYEQSALVSPSRRTVDAGFQMINAREEAERQRIAAEEEAERQRIAAENAAALERVQEQKAKQGVVAIVEERAEQRIEQEMVEYDLPAVDWSVGQEAFVEEWTARIDAYLAGSPLEGYGYAFAEAAWDNGVDPRWSPAISNTESSKGAVCFLPYNAWGWGEGTWGDWETAIRAHVAGLASGYGYCITPEAAASYCPPNAAFWYAHTIEQMATI